MREHSVQGSPVTLYTLAPPYESFEPVHETTGRGFGLAPGVLLALDLRDGPETDGLGELTLRLRRANPATPLIARIPPPERISPDYVLRLGALELRAVVHDAEPFELTLRRTLPRTDGLEEPLARWFEMRQIDDPIVTRLVRALFGPSKPADTRELAGRLTIPARTLRHQLTVLGLPPPRRWFALRKLLPALLQLQMVPRMPIARAAAIAGFHDQSAFGVAVRRETGFTPTEARTLLGWEWLVSGWLGRRGPSYEGHR